MSLLQDLNQRYIELHTAKENAFWQEKMGLSDYVPGSAEETEIALKDFISDASWLPKLRAELEKPGLSDTDRTSLEGWIRFFEANAIESEEAKEVQRKIIGMEGELARARRSMESGYIDPDSGDFVRASSVALRLIVLSDPDERKRKAAWEGLRAIEDFVLEHGFLDIVKERNRFGRLLGYDDFYAWKVQVSEGFSKQRLFELLGELEEHSRDACKLSVDKVKSEKGEEAAQPWNFEHATAGDLTSEKDPYLRFDSAVKQWGRSFTAMGIRYHGAKLTLDLLDRKGKYENGFMHGPYPAWIEDGSFHPAKINFTANSVPGQVGSGAKALETLFHEGGHAAHFANVKMPAPCFAQEFAPTSIAYAETQSMFLDSVCDDPDWLTKYALDADGNPMPSTLIRRIIEEKFTFRAHFLRKLMIVPYFEKAMYEMPDEERTPENLKKAAREIEATMVFQPSDSRPVMSVPHILESESSAYYHAYVLALMAVNQTRAFFHDRDGVITDNPKVGEDLARGYWQPGNSIPFLDLVEKVTGKPFSAEATVDLVNTPLDVVYQAADAAIDRAKQDGGYSGKVDLDATVTMIHGDDVVASTETEGSFEAMAEAYGAWIRAKEE